MLASSLLCFCYTCILLSKLSVPIIHDYLQELEWIEDSKIRRFNSSVALMRKKFSLMRKTQSCVSEISSGISLSVSHSKSFTCSNSLQLILIFENLIYAHNDILYLPPNSKPNSFYLTSNMSPFQLRVLLVMFDKPPNSIRASQICIGVGPFTGVWENSQWPHPQIGILVLLKSGPSFSWRAKLHGCFSA